MTSKRWQIAHWTYLSVLFCLLPVTVLLNVFACIPIPAYYTLQGIANVKDPRTIRCISQDGLGYATRALHIITDWFLLPVPLIIIWRLQMPWSRKIRLMAVFCIGFISSVASIMRNVLTERLGSDITCKLLVSSLRGHETYQILKGDYYPVYAWDVVDIFFATIVASLPALNGLVDQSVARLKQWGSTSSSWLLNNAFGSSNSNSERLPSKVTKDAFHDKFIRQGKSLDSKESQEPMTPIISRPSDIELQRPSHYNGSW